MIGEKNVSRKISIRLRPLLSERGITQKELAEKTGLREATISRIARDAGTSISFEHLARIADALNVDDIRELIELKK